MWIVLLNFFLFLLLLGFFCRGIKSWLGIFESDEETEQSAFEKQYEPDCTGSIFALGILIIGLSTVSLLKALL